MNISSNLKAKISFFGPPLSVTNNLGGSNLNNNDSATLNFALHLLCDICYGLFDNDCSKPYLIVPCGHPICMKCLKLTKNKCPTCGTMQRSRIINWGLLNYMQALIQNEQDTIIKQESQSPINKQIRLNNRHSIIKNFVNNYSLNKHKWSILCLKYLEKDRFASGSLDNTVKIWNMLNNFTLLHTLYGHTEAVNTLELISPALLASGSNDASIRIWNLEIFECERALSVSKFAIDCIRTLPNDRFASGSRNKTLHILSSLTFECLRKIDIHSDCIFGLEILLNDRIASASWDKTIKIWDFNKNNDFNCIATLTGHTGNSKNSLIFFVLFIHLFIIS